ncbi:MAG: outer membrane lipase/esterase [Gammaproteobacteria bacterium]|jgi:outer membrane lipase/esterase
MNTWLGKFATALILGATSHLAIATEILNPYSNALVEASVNTSQSAVGTTIGKICPGGLVSGGGSLLSEDLSARCTELVAPTSFSETPLTADELRDVQAGLQGMAPEEDAVIASSTVDGSSVQVDAIGNRFAAIHAGGAGVVQTNNGYNWSTGAAGDGNSPWGFFINGLYVSSERDSTSRESGFEADDWGVTGGIDYAFSDKFIFGLAFGYKNSEADIDANGGELETDSTSYFAYWSFLPNEHWYVDAMAGYTENDHEQERNISYSIAAVGAAGTTTVSNTALSDTDSDEISVSVSAGYNYFLNNWVLSPYGRVEYADIEIDGFTESMAQTAAAGSGLALQIDDQEFESLTLSGGVSASTQWGQSYFPRVSVEYVHEFDNDNQPINARFVNDTSRTTFSLLTDSPDRNYFNIGAAMTAVISDTSTGFVRYQGLFGYRDLDVHAFEVGVRLSF